LIEPGFDEGRFSHGFLKIREDKMRTTRRWWAFYSILVAAALVGCETTVIPPSGPVGTEICFDPMPNTAYQPGYPGEVIDCGWWVEFRGDLQAGFKTVSTYTWEECLPVPDDFLPGDQLRVTVTGDTGYGYFKCQWIDYFQFFPGVPRWKLTGYFLVTE
jgi:hypothetical protein